MTSPHMEIETPGLRDAARDYAARGWRPIRIRALGKKPASPAWQNSTPTPDQFAPTENVGINHAESGALVDVDLDIPHARALAAHPHLFGHLPAFGREGQLPGHRLVACPDALRQVVEFNLRGKAEHFAVAALDLPKHMVLELRAKGQTVFPPSRYAVDGGVQAVVWSAGAAPAEIPEMPWAEVRRRAGILALLGVVAAAFPDRGDRDNVCLHLAGTLVRMGLDPEAADDLVVAVAELAGDEENRRGKAATAAERLAGGEPVTGLPTLLQHLGLAPCLKRIRDWTGLPDDDGLGAPIPEGAIDVGRPDTHALLRDIEVMLVRQGAQVFRRHGVLVRVSRLEEPSTEDGVFRSAGIVELRSATPTWMSVEADKRGGVFVQRKGDKILRVSPPVVPFVQLQHVADESLFPPVRGLSLTPTLRCDRPGYDPDSRLFLAFPEGMFPPAPTEPTRAEAEAAIARLEHPLREFPFVDDASKAVALSAMLAAVVRGEMRTCPLHIFDAPAAGTGKTKIAEIVGLLGTGVFPSGVTHSTDTEENEKRLVSILRTGDPVVLIDNVSSDLEGDFLCAMLTSDTVQARILGQSERVRLDTRVLVLATGNNMRVRGDMSRRVVHCRLDARTTNPEERRFDFDPVADVREVRAQFVVDALTVVRAYIAAGRPAVLAPFGGFEDYDLVRGALVWLGKADPAATRQRVKADNPLVEEKTELFRAIASTVGANRSFSTRAIGERLGGLRSRIEALLPGGKWDKTRAGHLLRRHKDVLWLGVELRSFEDKHTKTMVWRLEGQPDPALVDEQKEDGPCPF